MGFFKENLKLRPGTFLRAKHSSEFLLTCNFLFFEAFVARLLKLRNASLKNSADTEKKFFFFKISE